MTTDEAKASPPWTTRWPTASTSVDLVEDADLGVGEDPQHPLDGGAVLEDLAVVGVGFALGDLEHQSRVGETDLFDQTGGQGPVVVRVHPLEVGLDDLELDRRRSTVENEDFHWIDSIAADAASDAQASRGLSSGRRSVRRRLAS